MAFYGHSEPDLLVWARLGSMPEILGNVTGNHGYLRVYTGIYV
jgi:hypothetical protein